MYRKGIRKMRSQSLSGPVPCATRPLSTHSRGFPTSPACSHNVSDLLKDSHGFQLRLRMHVSTYGREFPKTSEEPFH